MSCVAAPRMEAAALGLSITNYSSVTGASLFVQGAPGHAVRLEASSTASPNPLDWAALQTNALDAAGHSAFSDPTAAGLEARFYRAVDLDSGLAFSTNVVGFVNRTVPEGRSLVANPFRAPDARLRALWPSLPHGVSVYQVGPDGEPAVANHAFGWSDSAQRLLPGEGALIENRSGSNFVITFQGDVVQGAMTNYLPAGTSLAGSIMPQAGVLDTELMWPCQDGDAVHRWTGTSYRVWVYTNDTVNAGWSDPDPPRLALGESSWAEKSEPAEWVRELVITGSVAATYAVTNHALNALQPKVNFVTYHADPAFGRVFDSTVGAPLDSSFRGQLYAGTNADEGGLVALGSPVSFLDGAGAGYIRAGLVPVLDFVDDTPVCLQLRVWEAARGSSYELARANGGRVGKSETFWVEARKDFAFSGLPAPANGFESFRLTGCTTITNQPRSQTRPLGGAVTFAVGSVAVPPRYYQWWHSDGTNPVALGTDRSLTLTNLSWADAGTYWVTISNSTCVVTSEPAILTLFGPPEIRVNGEIPTGNAVTLTGPARVELGSSLPGGHLFYTLDGSDPARGQMYFGPFEVRRAAALRVVVYTADFSQWLAHGIFLNLLEAPSITRSPPPKLLLPVGGNAALPLEARGNPVPQCQWARDGAPLPGATNLNLHLVNVQFADAGRYAAVVTNVMGAATSAVVEVIVRAPPSVVVVPGSTNILLGSNITFYAQATGSPPLLYQWRKNGVNIPGATNDSLTITNVQLRDGGSYSVVVANDVGAATSDPALLLVEVPTTAAPPGDHFDDRVSLGTNVFAAGTNWFATREAGEPYHADKFGSNSVWYAWRAPGHGIVTFRTVGSAFDTLLGVYTNDLSLNPQPSIFNLMRVASDEDRGGYLTSEARCHAVEDVEYQIAVDGFAGQQGAFTLSLEFEPTPQVLPVMLEEPSSQTVTQGATVTISVRAAGAGLRYQWHFNGEPIPGATHTNLTLTNVSFEAVGYYTVAITNDDQRGVVSLPAILELGGQPRTVVSEDKWEDWVFSPPVGPGALLRLAMAAPGGAASPILVGAGMFDFQVFNNSTNSTPEDHCSRMMNATRWLYLRTTNEGTLRLDTLGSSVPTILAVYLSEGGRLSPVDCAATNAPDGHSTLLWVNAAGGRTYAIAVDGCDRQTGNIWLNWALGEAPEITAETRSYVVRRGSPLILRPGVSAGLPTNSTCQWFRDGQPLAGATARTLTLPSVQRTDVGVYAVLVSNLIGSVWHEAATVDLDLTQLTLAESTFESGHDGWSVSGDVTNLTFQATGGNPDGCLAAQDRHIGGMWYWVAPPLYLGNLADAYGGWLQFDLWQSAKTMPTASWADVELIGGGLMLCFNTATNPGLAWTSYKVPLHEAWGWTRDTIDGAAATKAELLQVLSNLTALRIRGEFSSEADFGGLDNVAVLAPTPPLVIRRSPGNQVVLRWPVYPPGFQPEYAFDLLEPGWFTNLPPAALATDTNWFRVTVPLGEASRFFRLRKR